MAQHEVSEGPELEEEGIRLLEHEWARVAALPDLKNVVVEQGSQLWLDDQSTNYDPVSQQIIFMLAISTDHLETIERLVRSTKGGIAPFAFFSLIRGGIEAAAHALWLISGGTADKRVFRSLHLIYKSRHDVEPLAKSLGLANPQGLARMKARLDELKAARPGIRNHSFDRVVKTTDVIIDADRTAKTRRQFNGLDVWKACSGIAHANRMTAMMLMERKEFGRHDERTGNYQFTASVIVLAWMYQVVVDYLAVMTDRYVAAAKAPAAKGHHPAAK